MKHALQESRLRHEKPQLRITGAARHFLTIATCLATLSSALADDEPASPLRQVRIQMEFIEVDHRDLTKLLFLSKPASTDATELRKTLARMIDEGKAEVVETLLVMNGVGKGSTDSLHEFIYPTEFEPPSIPDQVRVANPGDEPATTEAELEWMDKLRTGITPVAFETTNLGSSLSANSVISDSGRIINTQIAAEMAWHTGNMVWSEDKQVNGDVSQVRTPQIYRLNVNTQLTCISGQYNHIAVLSPKDDEGKVDYSRKLMVFVKCDVLTIGEDDQ